MKWLSNILAILAPKVSVDTMRPTTYIPVLGDLPKGVAQWMAETASSPCHNAPLIAGPRGGISQNVWCSKCHARYNVVFEIPDMDWGQCTDVKDDRSFA